MFSYIVLFDANNQAISFATIQIIAVYLDSVQNEMQSVVEWIKCMGRKLRLVSSKKPFKILTCGNTFVSGEHGIFIGKNQDKKLIVKLLAKAVVQFSKDNLKYQIDAFMLKDFEDESLFITDALHKVGYYSFNVEPNMVLTLDENWRNFTDYLAALKTKFRVKAKRALTLSEPLRVEDVDATSLVKLLPKMTNLYKTVSENAGFNLGDFNLETYQLLKENLQENYIVKAYWLDDVLVGFLSGMITEKSVDAHFVGIDYSYNRSHAVYQRMLYDYILLAIDKKVTTLNFGRTASEIKSSVGAVPQNLTIYLRHRSTISNQLLSPFLRQIQPTEFKQKHPFKQKN